MDVIIRPAREDDVDDLAAVHSASLQEAYKDVVDAQFLRSRLSFPARRRGFAEELETGEPTTLILFSDDEAAGLLSYGAPRHSAETEKTCELWRLYIRPNHQREGLGQALFKKARQAMAAEGYARVILWALEEAPGARLFHETLGFSDTGITREIDVGRKARERKYALTLGG